MTCRSKIAKSSISEIQDGRHDSHLENLCFASSPELNGHLTRNLVGSIGVRALEILKSESVQPMTMT